jgi:MFS family permease
MVLVAPRSAALVESKGSRFVLLCGYVFCLLGFLTMLLLWDEGIAYWKVALGYAFMGIGVGLAGTPASHSLTGSVPVRRAGMASGTADLQRDLGGAIMQSIFGALLTAGFATAMGAAIVANPGGAQVTESVQSQLTKSFASADAVAAQYPEYSSEITAAAKTSFLDGDDKAYAAGILAIVICAGVVYFMFPKKAEEEEMLTRFQAEDRAEEQAIAGPAPEPATDKSSPSHPGALKLERRREGGPRLITKPKA